MIGLFNVIWAIWHVLPDHGGDSQFWAYMTVTAGVLFIIVLVWLFARNFAPELDEDTSTENEQP